MDGIDILLEGAGEGGKKIKTALDTLPKTPEECAWLLHRLFSIMVQVEKKSELIKRVVAKTLSTGMEKPDIYSAEIATPEWNDVIAAERAAGVALGKFLTVVATPFEQADQAAKLAAAHATIAKAEADKAAAK